MDEMVENIKTVFHIIAHSFTHTSPTVLFTAIIIGFFKIYLKKKKLLTYGGDYVTMKIITDAKM